MSPLFQYIQTIESTISLVTVAAGVVGFIWHRYSYKTITLSCGTFRIRRKFFNSVDMTTIVSNLFYNGGQVDGQVRQEIFRITGTMGEIVEVPTVETEVKPSTSEEVVNTNEQTKNSDNGESTDIHN